jgi:hypothetical protein
MAGQRLQPTGQLAPLGKETLKSPHLPDERRPPAEQREHRTGQSARGHAGYGQNSQASVFGDRIARALKRQSRSVTIAGRGRRARSAVTGGLSSSLRHVSRDTDLVDICWRMRPSQAACRDRRVRLRGGARQCRPAGHHAGHRRRSRGADRRASVPRCRRQPSRGGPHPVCGPPAPGYCGLPSCWEQLASRTALDRLAGMEPRRSRAWPAAAMGRRLRCSAPTGNAWAAAW